jgi:hypothetical protein
LIVTVIARIWLVGTRWADFTSARLDAGVEASGPHDFAFAVRESAVRQHAVDRSQAAFDPPCDLRVMPDAAASTASRPASVTIAIRPCEGRDGDAYNFDLGK